MKPTERYIEVLQNLKSGDLSLLRAHVEQGLDTSSQGFDLFAGLWWPLREKNQRAPRREVAWLIAKLYAFRPIPHSDNSHIAYELRSYEPHEERARQSYLNRFDRMLEASLRRIEPHLQWALNVLDVNDSKLDWVKLTDELSIWERESTRMKWVKKYLSIERK